MCWGPHRLAHRLNHVAEGRRVGIADAEADHLDPVRLLLLDLALEFGEHEGGIASSRLDGSVSATVATA